MIVVQSPLRISFFGGGTDFPSFYLKEGGCVLSSAIDKRIYVTAKYRFDEKLRIGYTRTELVNNLDEIQHELIREALRMSGIRQGIEISSMGDIPSAGSGLGSSSSVTVGALLALHALSERKVTPEQLARDACAIEIEVLGKPIGVQDQYIAAYGGLRFMEFTVDGRVLVEPVRADPETISALNRNLLLFYSGVTRKSEMVLTEQQANIGDRMAVLREMRDLAYEARSRLEQGELDAFGTMLHHTWTLKRQLASGISNGQIAAIYDRARRAGALGGKVTGAGGGGFILLYCPREKQAEVREALSDLRELPFGFDPDGARVILDQKNEEALLRKERRAEQSSGSLATATRGANGSAPIVAYLRELHRGLDGLQVEDIEAVIELLHRARIERRKVFIMGNGGSASTASHFACDLGKNTRIDGLPDFRVVALTDNLATFSALANDEGYENVFVGQLANLMESGDVVIGISTSGNSPNVVRAIEFANVGGAHTVGLTGPDGGRLARAVDFAVKVPNQVIEQVEDIHLMLQHLICTAINDRALRERRLRAPAPLAEAPHAPGYMLKPDLDPESIRLLYEFNDQLASGNRAEGFARRLLRLATKKLRAESGSVILLDRQGSVAGGSIGYDGQVHDRRPEELADVFERGLAGWSARQRKAALVRNTRQDRRWLCKPWEENGSSGRAAISAPIVSNGLVMGVVTLARAESAAYSARDLALLQAFAFCASLVAQEADPGVDQPG